MMALSGSQIEAKILDACGETKQMNEGLFLFPDGRIAYNKPDLFYVIKDGIKQIYCVETRPEHAKPVVMVGHTHIPSLFSLEELPREDEFHGIDEILRKTGAVRTITSSHYSLGSMPTDEQLKMMINHYFHPNPASKSPANDSLVITFYGGEKFPFDDHQFEWSEKEVSIGNIRKTIQSFLELYNEYKQLKELSHDPGKQRMTLICARAEKILKGITNENPPLPS